MSDRAHTREKSAATAVVCSDGFFRCATVRRKSDVFAIENLQSEPGDAATWRSFAEKHGIISAEAGRNRGKSEDIVAAYEGTGVIFYDMTLPRASSGEMESMVRLQTEAKLPVPIDQIELAWRTGMQRNGEKQVTVAAARREQLGQFVGQVTSIEPARIILGFEATVSVWRQLFAGTDARAIVVNMRRCDTQVCLSEHGRLVNAASIDIGTDQIEAAGSAERFVRDFATVVTSFGYGRQDAPSICVLSSGGGTSQAIAMVVRANGFSAEEALVAASRIADCATAEQVYEYREAIGSALAALDDAQTLDLFKRIYRQAGEPQRLRWYHSVKVTGAVAAAALILLVLVWYGADAARLAAIERTLSSGGERAKFEDLVSRQQLIKTVARERVDLLTMMKQINEADAGGVKLEAISFKRGQPVSITGQAPSTDALYTFQKKLQDSAGISEVNIQSAPQDKQTRQYKFVMTFHYRDYTRKRS